MSSLLPAANILNALDEAVCVFEKLPLRADGLRDYRYVFVNNAFKKLFHTGDLAGLSVRENFPDEPESWYDDYDEVLHTGIPKRFIREAPSQHISIEMFLTRLEDGSENRLLNTMRDVTQRLDLENSLKKSEIMLQESESNLRNMILQAPIAICLLSGPELIVEVINDKFILLWGKDESVRGKPILEALPEMIGQPYPEILRNVYKNGETYYGNEAEVLLFRNGRLETGYFNFVNQPYRNADGEITGVIVTATEVTEQVLANNALQTTIDQLRLSKEAAELGLFDLDLKKGTLVWDTRCRELFGVSHSNEVTYDGDFVNGLHPDDRDRITKIIDDCFVKEKSGGVYDVEYRTIGQEDKKERWVRAKGQVYFDENDQPVRFIGSVIDITEQKLDELRKNDFIGMVSHELKTPLTTLSALTQVMKAKLAEQEDRFLKTASDKVEKQIRRMSVMINGFLNVSRLESGKLQLNTEVFDLSQLLDEVVSEARLLNYSQHIEYHHCGKMIVKADREKILSVVLNLLSNAAKYSTKDDAILVTCNLKDGFAKVSVHDKGIGIKPEDQQKLFDRYYRVENPLTSHISGFGIGLYLSAEIVYMHGGKIWVDSEPGKGSVFSFTLPVS